MELKSRKRDLSKELNELLEARINFERLAEKDLVELYNILTTPARLYKLVVKVLKTRVEGKILDMPLRKVLSEDGVLGFGILPNLLSVLKDVGKGEGDKEKAE